MRIPAYCDRILFKGENIKQLSLSRLECKISDHRPIASAFICQIRSIDTRLYSIVEKKSVSLVDKELNNIAYAKKITWVMSALGVQNEEAVMLVSQVAEDVKILMAQFE